MLLLHVFYYYKGADKMAEIEPLVRYPKAAEEAVTKLTQSAHNSK